MCHCGAGRWCGITAVAVTVKELSSQFAVTVTELMSQLRDSLQSNHNRTQRGAGLATADMTAGCDQAAVTAAS